MSEDVAFSHRSFKQGSGQFINIASAAGIVNLPRMAPYNATKSAVIAISETLRHELAEFGIGVSVVCPSFFRTNLHESARMSDPESKLAAILMITQAPQGPDLIADIIFRKARGKTFLIQTHIDTKVAHFIKKIIPFSIYCRILPTVHKKVLQKVIEQGVTY